MELACYDSGAAIVGASIFLGFTAVMLVVATVATARLISGFAAPVSRAQPA